MNKIESILKNLGWKHKEIEILLMINEGLTDKAMAERLNLSVSGIKFRKTGIYRKLNLRGYGKKRPVYAVMIYLNKLVHSDG